MDAIRHFKALLFSAVTIIAIGLAVIGTSWDVTFHRQDNSSNKRQVLDLERWPVAGYDDTLPADLAKRAKRQAKNKKYDKSEWPILANDVADSTVRLHRVTADLPAFPKRESGLILIGRIVSATAYLSNDKTGVYSEFTAVVEEVLKNNLPEQLVAGSSITLTREGGRIRFPSGRMHWYGIGRQNMPGLGGRYVLFVNEESEQTLTILTGYELANGKITPLDDLNNARKYQDADELTFLKSLRNSLTDPGELHTLQVLGLKTIDLDYKKSRRTDQHGNQLRYRAKVKDTRDAQIGRWAWDVFLLRD